MEHIVIIGNGIAGITAARHIRKASDKRITVISSESDHFYSRTALMYIYMGHMTFEHTKPYEDWFWSKNKIELVRGLVERIDIASKSVVIAGSSALQYDKLIIASGSASNKFGWPGQDLDGVQGLYAIQDVERMERETKGIAHATVVGGGLIGIEMAEMLHSRHIPTSFLVREKSYMDYLLPAEESGMINDEIVRHGIDLRLETELSEIVGDSGRAASVTTSKGDRLDTQFVGLTAGVSPSIAFVKGSGIDTNRGILVDDCFRTNVEDVFAIGDCAEFSADAIGHRRIEQLWYSGRRHGETVAHTVVGEPRAYQRGIFFNSAKFFTIEYQTYGRVEAELDSETSTFVWTDPKRRKLIRINFRKVDRVVEGFNVFGIRFRQSTCEDWIRRQTPVDDVITQIKTANFDPEFTRSADKDLTQSFHKSRGGRQSSSPVST